MPGELKLETLLRNIQPVLHSAEYVFLTTNLTMEKAVKYNPVGLFAEPEGLTILIEAPPPSSLTSGSEVGPRFRMITLSVHSSLEAVGFMAAVAGKLADAGISVNPVAGYFHDHLFVPTERATDAISVIQSFAQG